MKKILSLLVFLFASSANATLIGDSVDCSTTGTSWSCDPTGSTVVTDPGVEYGINVHSSFRAMDLDITGNSLNFDVVLGVGNILGIGPLSIFNIDTVITGFTFNTNISGMDLSRLSFTNSSFNVDFDSLNINDGEYLDINLQFASVPEPATLVLLGLGLAGIGFSRRQKA